jgi:hypothetical protein
MRGHECYHCKQWVDEGEAHDCWTTTEAALLSNASEDVKDAYERLREAASDFGEQRIYASHKSIMFSRKSCYFFVRPKTKHLELCMFLGRPVKAPQIRRVAPGSKTKFVHTIHVKHRDEVEAPITDWLREAYEFGGAAPAPASRPSAARKKAAAQKKAIKTAAKKTAPRKTTATRPRQPRRPGRRTRR